MKYAIPCVVLAFGFFLGSFAAGPVNATAPAQPQTLRVRAVEIVDDGGKVVASFGSYGDAAGIWVGSDDYACLVSRRGTGPYLGFGNKPTRHGCNVALTLHDGNPTVQLVDEQNRVEFVDFAKALKK